MTISTTDSRKEYVGNGVTTAFPIPFRFLENSHIVVTYVINSAQTDWVMGSDYTLSGADDDAGGMLIATVAPVSLSTLIIRRVVPATQETDYISGDPFPAESHERAIDKLTMLAQQSEEVDARSLKFPVGDTEAQIGELPAAMLRAGRLLAFDANGRPTFAIPSDQSAASLQIALAGFGGSQMVWHRSSALNAVARSTFSKLDETVSIREWVATAGDGASAVTAFNFAVAHMNANPGTTVSLPDGEYLIDAGVTPILSSHSTFVGQGENTVIRITATGSAFRWGDDSALQILGGGFENCRIIYSAAPALGAVVFDVRNASRQGWYDMYFENPRTILRLANSANKPVSVQHAMGFRGYVYNSGSPTFDLRHGAGFFTDDIQLFVPVAAPVHPASMPVVDGTNFINISTGHWDTVIIGDNVLAERYSRGIYVYAASTIVINNLWVGSAVFDYNARGLLFYSETNANVVGVHLNGTWCTAWDGTSVSFDGPGNNTMHQLNEVRAFLAAEQGIYVAAAVSHIDIDSPMVYATNRGGGGASAIEVACSDFGIAGGRVNFDTAFVGLPYQSPFGVSIGSNLDRYRVTDTDARGTTAGFSIGGDTLDSKNRRVSGNINANYAGAKAGGIYALPASNVAWVNTTPFVVEMHVYGGTVAGIAKNATNLGGATHGSFVLDPGESIIVTYSSAPTVTWFARA